MIRERATGGVGIRREEFSLQERLGGWAFRTDADLRDQQQPRCVDRVPGQAFLLPWPPRWPAHKGDVGERRQGCLIRPAVRD